MSLPYLNLYIGDIKKDTDLLSPAAFGAYVRLLFKMHEAAKRGEVAYSLPQLCRVFGAASLEETLSLLNEIVDPAYNICDYDVEGEKHCFINRRMKKETVVSQARSEAGKKGATKTNTKNKQNEIIAVSFAAANDTANTSTNTQENYNNNTGINNNDKIDKGGVGENLEPGFKVLIVPELLAIWKSLPEKKDYVVSKDSDYPALRLIGEMIAKLLNVSDYTSTESIDQIKQTFLLILNFILKDPLYKDFQLSQIAKYFNAITSKMKAQHNERKTQTNNGKPSIIDNNINAAQGARELLAKKYGG